MLRTILLTGCLTATLSGIAQNHLYIFAGPQANAARYTILNQKQEMDMKYGFQAGINMKTLFEGPIYFAPAVFYSLKGYDVTFTEFRNPPDVDAINNNTSIHTLELAPLLQIDLSKSASHPYIKIGPSMDFLLFGRETFDKKVNGSTERVNRDMKFSYTDYGHFSANMLMQIGFESQSGLMIFAQYTHGMASINNQDGGPKIRLRAYGVSLGWRIR